MSDVADVQRTFDAFLREVQASAFRLASMSLGNEADALDVCQDAMLTMAERYAHKPPSQWRALFFRVLRNRITDVHRRGQRWGKLFVGVFQRADDEDPNSVVDQTQAPAQTEPERAAMGDAEGERMLTALEILPERQRQAFVLRAVEGMDVRETAYAMGCTAGSVKTHYSRAMAALRRQLAPTVEDQGEGSRS